MNTTTTAPTATKIALAFPLADAITAANAVLPHASKNDLTPILESAKITAEYWVASDRYSIGKYDIDAIETDTNADSSTATSGHPEEILIPREAVEWVAKIVASKLRHASKSIPTDNPYSLEISETESEHGQREILVSILFRGNVERSQAFDAVSGNYPNVERILNDWKPAENLNMFHISPDHLEKITGYVKRHFKGEHITLEIGSAGTGSDKPGPVRIKHGKLTALVQPVYLTR